MFLVLMVRAMLNKSLIQFCVDGWGCIPHLLFTWDQTMVELVKIMAISFKRSELWRVTQTQGRRTFLNCNFTWMPFVQKPLVLEVTEKWSVCDTGNFVLPPIREQPSLFQGEISKQNKTKLLRFPTGQEKYLVL